MTYSRDFVAHIYKVYFPIFYHKYIIISSYDLLVPFLLWFVRFTAARSVVGSRKRGPVTGVATSTTSAVMIPPFAEIDASSSSALVAPRVDISFANRYFNFLFCYFSYFVSTSVLFESF